MRIDRGLLTALLVTCVVILLSMFDWGCSASRDPAIVGPTHAAELELCRQRFVYVVPQDAAIDVRVGAFDRYKECANGADARARGGR